MILETLEHTYMPGGKRRSTRPSNIRRRKHPATPQTTTKYRLRCDNPECGKEYEKLACLVRKAHKRTNHPDKTFKEIRDFCSRRCSYTACDTRREITCKGCGKEFLVEKKVLNRGRKYCSNKCMESHVVCICKEEGCDEPVKARSYYNAANLQKHKAYCSKHKRLKGRFHARVEVLNLLGGKCAYCSEREPRYLQIDHVHNDGIAHRKEIASRRTARRAEPNLTPQGLWPAEVKRHIEKYPGSLQVLCANCNSSKNGNGGVPFVPDKFTRRMAA